MHTIGRHKAPNNGTIDNDRRRLALSICLNFGITVAEIVGGILSGSLALLSDALHNFSDTASQAISLFARRVASRDPDASQTFGYGRFEVVAAFFNLVTLFIIALFLAKEGVTRLLDPSPIQGTLMLGVAVVGLVVNIVSALLLRRGAGRSINIKSAYLHIVADAVSSVAVVIGAIVVILFDLVAIDPILTILISLYIMYQAYGALRETTAILMNGAPPGVHPTAVADAISDAPGVIGVHHLHVWLMDERTPALEAHVVINRTDLTSMEEIKYDIKRRLSSQFDIKHSTLEFEHDGVISIANCDFDHRGSAGGKADTATNG